MFKKSVVAKLWIAIVLSMTIVLVILSVGLFQLVTNFYFSQTAQGLINQGHYVAEIYRENTGGNVSREIDLIARSINAHILIVNEEGIIKACDYGLGVAPGGVFNASELKRVLAGNIVVKRGHHHHFETQMLSIAMPLSTEEGINQAIFMFTPIAPITAILGSLRELMYWALFGSIALASILTFFLSRTLSKPLIGMNQVAREMAKGDFNHQLKVTSDDEIGVLSHSLNHLAKQMKENISQLSHEKDKLKNVLTSMTDGVITLDPQGEIILANPQAEKIIATCPIMEQDKPILECTNFAQLNKLFKEVLEERAIKTGQITLGDKTFATRLAPLFDPEGSHLLGVVVILQDITKERILEEMRKEFVANVSHELRTPISLIRGYSEAILDGITEDGRQQREFIGIIHGEGKKLNRLVDDLLELSRLQSGEVRLEKEWVNLQEIIHQIQNKFQSSLREAQLTLGVSIEAKATKVWADRFKLEQVLSNLVSNAIRYAPRGRITIQGFLEDNTTVIRVSDTGQGIEPQDLPFIFERFYRADKSRNRETGGTGLGLSIVKNIIDAHGGEITVESHGGEGTTFTIRLPQT